jgi:protein-tyrosine phosphatase
MTPTLYRIPGPWRGQLAITARPRGGDWLNDEVNAWKAANVEVVASLLTPEEEETLNLKEEEKACVERGLVYRLFPMPDRGVPQSYENAISFIKVLEDDLVQGKTVAIHCRQGLGRSALISASLLVLSGLDPEAAVKRVSIARAAQVPETPEQLAWIGGVARHAAHAHPQT